QAPNFHKLKIDEEIRSVLRFDEGKAAAWTLPSVAAAVSAAQHASAETSQKPKTFATPPDRSTPNTISCILYVFRWKPGRNSALLDLPRVSSAQIQGRIRPGCPEAHPNGREPNVFARCWKDAAIWDSR